LQALAADPVAVRPFIIGPRALDVPGVDMLVDAQGWVAKRYDAQPGTAYLLRPDQHVAARWRQLDVARVRQALALATCNA
ncbi:MAG: 3-(3-hydroxy-phenyl)propionate/3-hydroxycinnamic acid hydroxylase, partial [Pseudomonadota bacterium]